MIKGKKARGTQIWILFIIARLLIFKKGIILRSLEKFASLQILGFKLL